jgi:hypothetical protein
MIQKTSGTPIAGYVQLTPGSLGPVAIPIFTLAGGSAYTLQAASGGVGGERIYIAAITVSTNDSTQRLVTIDTGGATPTKLANVYVTSTLPPVAIAFAPGTVRGIAATALRATVSALSASTTIEVTISGYVSRS